MFVVRLLLILTALSIVITGGLYMFTRNRRYLHLTMQTIRFVVFALMIFFVLFVLERYVLVGWKVLVLNAISTLRLASHIPAPATWC